MLLISALLNIFDVRNRVFDALIMSASLIYGALSLSAGALALAAPSIVKLTIAPFVVLLCSFPAGLVLKFALALGFHVEPALQWNFWLFVLPRNALHLPI